MEEKIKGSILTICVLVAIITIISITSVAIGAAARPDRSDRPDASLGPKASGISCPLSWSGLCPILKDHQDQIDNLQAQTNCVCFKGDQGPKGDPGPKGNKGDDGDKGDLGPKGDPGPKGDKGDDGDKGDQGAQGIPGAQGSAGLNGKTILSGSGAPIAAEGSDGDFYIDTTENKIYGPKANGAWPTSGTSLVGPEGPPVKFGEKIDKEFYDESSWETTTYTADTDGFVYAYIHSPPPPVPATPNQWVGLFGFVYTGPMHQLSDTDVINYCMAHDESDSLLATILMPVQKSEHWTVMKYVENVPDGTNWKVVWLPLAA